MNRTFLLRIISILMVVGLIVVVGVSMTADNWSNKSMDEVSDVIIPLFDNEKSKIGDEMDFKRIYGLNASDYEGMTIYIPTSNVEAEELLIVKLKSEEQSEEILNAINKRIEDQKNIFGGYEPKAYSMCDGAIVDLKGNYVMYVVHKDAVEIDKAFDNEMR